MIADASSALVLFSGGQDSTTCLAWALARYSQVETIGFDYGQRHWVEMDCRKQILNQFRSEQWPWSGTCKEDHVIDMGFLGDVGETALTGDVDIQMSEDGLPNTFVPGRNLLFFTVAAAIAYRRGIKHLVGGMCETDYSGYPDCRDDTLKSLQATVNLGMDSRFVIQTPLMWLNKAETWKLAESLGEDALVELIRIHSHSCYLGYRSEEHEWGYGCGACPACELRLAGWREYRGTS